jgi:hypothetical protein
MVAPTPVPDAYLFVCETGEVCALSVEPDGGNLPSTATTKNWSKRGAVPMTLAALGAYAPYPEIAMTNLIMRGYHLIRVSAQIVPFPRRGRV